MRGDPFYSGVSFHSGSVKWEEGSRFTLVSSRRDYPFHTVPVLHCHTGRNVSVFALEFVCGEIRVKIKFMAGAL